MREHNTFATLDTFSSFADRNDQQAFADRTRLPANGKTCRKILEKGERGLCGAT
jgi:hypothetical protein